MEVTKADSAQGSSWSWIESALAAQHPGDRRSIQGIQEAALPPPGQQPDRNHVAGHRHGEQVHTCESRPQEVPHSQPWRLKASAHCCAHQGSPRLVSATLWVFGFPRDSPPAYRCAAPHVHTYAQARCTVCRVSSHSKACLLQRAALLPHRQATAQPRGLSQARELSPFLPLRKQEAALAQSCSTPDAGCHAAFHRCWGSCKAPMPGSATGSGCFPTREAA